MSFENRSFVIFGATGGIGTALGRQLAPLGCRLTLAARDQSRLDTLSGELHAEACSVEATDSDAVDRCLVKASEKYAGSDWIERHPSTYYTGDDYYARHRVDPYAGSDWIERHPCQPTP